MRRTTLREIRGSMGRYLAILTIIALGVGFFTGLKLTKTQMVATIDAFVQEKNFYDFRLLSTLGFVQEDVEALRSEADVRYAEGVYSYDALYSGIGENEVVLKTMSLPEQVNGINLVEGRMPENEKECVLDVKVENVQLGDTLVLTGTNEKDTLDAFEEQSFTVVGLVQSSYYMNFERGTTSLGNGKVGGFVYMEPEAFTGDYYTDIFVRFQQDYEIYSDEYEDYIAEHKEQWETLAEERADIRYHSLKSEAQAELADAEEEFNEQKADGEAKLQEAYEELTDAQTQLAEGRRQLDAAWVEYENNEQEVTAKAQQLLEQKQALEAKQGELQQVILQLPEEQKPFAEQQRQELENALAALAAAEEAIEAGKGSLSEARNALVQKELEWKDAQAELDAGMTEYEANKAEFDDEIADAEQTLQDVQGEIDAIKAPSVYVLDRKTNIGYACFESDSEIVNAVAKVFPVFFILVAALVCMTTMNRMVEEQRTQIGTLKALGYSEGRIMKKFMVYSGSAALLGCLVGYGVGTVAFPQVIWNAYGMMYLSIPLKYVFSWRLLLISLAASMLCSIGTTWLTCHHELQESAAGLMRPKAPRAGKRVFMERIPFIWNRLKFLHKVSIRNVLRYKKRFFMMIIGISGCTALVLTGFGIKDSIADFAQLQYEEIQILDGTVELKEAADKSDMESVEKALTQCAEAYSYVSESSWELVYADGVKAVNLVIPEAAEEFDNYMNLHTRRQEPLAYPQAGEALINSGLAERYQLQTGDEIKLQNEAMEPITVRIAGIFENYVYNYVLISADTYEQQMGKAPEYKTIYVNFKEDTDIHEAAAGLMKPDAVASVQLNQDTRERITAMMSSLNYVVVMVILCAAGLAFIVLYNLTNINITERVREIATVKVLGFFRRETETYVFRENMILTAIGSLVGLGLGVLLHAFVMEQIKVDMVSFSTIIKPVSYLYSVALTFVFYWKWQELLFFLHESINSVTM